MYKANNQRLIGKEKESHLLIKLEDKREIEKKMRNRIIINCK